jgi:hypothetical protein
MKKLLILLIFLCTMIPVSLQATTHMWFWVNGEISNTITQGDNFAWEFDLSSVGGSASVEIYLDINESRTIDGGDYLFDVLTITDGEQGDGPSDSSTVPDGNIYLQFGPFGFAPGSYVIRVTDTDETTASNWFESLPMTSPPATASGTITIQGTAKPNSKYENVMIGAMGEYGLFSGLTDANGNYVINLPVGGGQWQIGTLFDNTLPGYLKDPEGYQLTIPAGNTGSLDFNFTLPSSYVYGAIYDQNGTLIERDGYITLSNMTTDNQNQSVVKGGYYNLPAQVEIMGNDSMNAFILRPDENMLVPDYLNPPDNHPFNLTWGDSLEHNLTAYQTNATIIGYITENGGSPSKTYKFTAWADSLGSTWSESDPATGYFVLHVRTGVEYNIWLQDDPEYGTPPPPGYIVEKNWQFVMPGDTVRFNLIPAHAAIAGTISFEAGDPVDLDYNNSQITAWDSTYTQSSYSRIDNEGHFFIPVTDGKYEVMYNDNNTKYLAMPSRYSAVSVQADTIDTLHFELNYAHATITVKLSGEVPMSPGNGYWINTLGNWPWVYQTGSDMQPDSTYHLNVCEGQWYLQPPIWADPQVYAIIPSDTTLTVTENDSSYYVEFNYRLWTGLSDSKQTPASFYLNQNYPNPFNPSTTIAYGLMKSGEVKLEVYNILGEKVATLVDGVQNTGTYQLTWRPENLASGVYLYRLETAGFVQSRKLILIR